MNPVTAFKGLDKNTQIILAAGIVLAGGFVVYKVGQGVENGVQNGVENSVSFAGALIIALGAAAILL